MTCKNCQTTLRTDFSYCPGCGAKVIRKRITLKNLWTDFAERFFNLDNTVLKTISHLFTQPEQVIGGYLNGQRKKYLNPISYFTIALTLSGLLVFIIQRFYGAEVFDFSQGAGQATPEFAKKWAEIVFDLNAFFFVMYIPVLAFPAYLIMNKAKYNFPENLIVFIYILAHYSVCSFPVSLVSVAIDPAGYLDLSRVVIGLMLVYCIYVLQRLHHFSWKALFLRSSLFLGLVVILFFMLVIGLMAALLVVGVFELKDFAAPPKPQAISSAINWASYKLL